MILSCVRVRAREAGWLSVLLVGCVCAVEEGEAGEYSRARGVAAAER